ncbi:MAG: DUF2079 domain-containing protein [Thermoplasmatales archaeon]
MRIIKIILTQRGLKNNWHFLVLISAVLLYIIYWSFITIYRIITFQAGVYDLGLMEQEFYLTMNSSSLQGLFIAFLNKDTSIIFAPLYYFHSLDALVIFQTIFLGTPAILIYAISIKVLKSKNYALIFSIIYLLYPLLYGVNWFDVHNMAFFIFFFLLGFYLFLIEKYKLSLLFIILSGMTHYLLLGIPILFAIPLLYECIVTRSWSKKSSKFAIFILALSLTILIISYIINSSININVTSTVHTGNLNILAFFPDKMLTFLIAVIPVGFLALYPNRYFLLMLPFLVIMFLSTETIYFYPGLLTDQYASSLIPGVFISAIYGFSKIKKMPVKLHIKSVRLLRPSGHASRNIMVIAVISTIVLALIFAPFAPIVNHSNLYKTELPLSKYTKLYQEFSTVVSLIPVKTPYIIIGDNEPTVLPLPQAENAPVLVTPYTITSNLTYRELNSLVFRYATINYVIGNPYGEMFTQGSSSPYNMSMFDLISKLYNAKSFGIVAEASGIILLQRNYAGPLQYYVPFNSTYGAAYMRAPTILGNIPISASNYYLTNNQPILFNKSLTLNGPMFLPAGIYKFLFSFKSTSTAEKGFVNVSVQDTAINENISKDFNLLKNQNFYVRIQISIPEMVEYMHLTFSTDGQSLLVNYYNVTQIGTQL